MTPTTSRTTALVTGASAGLGHEFARQLAAQGNDLVLVARNAARLAETAEDLRRRYGITAEVLPADLTDEDDVAAVVERLEDSTRPVGILVNNAGIGLLHNFEENHASDEKKHLRLHAETSMVLTHAALKRMLERGGGRIINVASVAAFLPRGTYSAAKAWLVSFSRWANLAYRKRGIKVTAVCPGFTHTEFTTGWGWTSRWPRPGRGCGRTGWSGRAWRTTSAARLCPSRPSGTRWLRRWPRWRRRG